MLFDTTRRENHMNSLIVFCYESPKKAEAALSHVTKQKQENANKPLVAIEDAAVVVKKDSGKVKVRQTMERVAKDSRAFGASVWGLFIGFLFGGPLLGALIGIVVGRVSGLNLDLGINNDFIDSIGEELQPGKSALFLLIDDAEPETIAQAMGDHAGVLLHTSIAEDAAAILGSANDHDEVRDAVQTEHLDEMTETE